MKAHQQTIGKNDEWLTPRYIFDPLGWFDLDPCNSTSLYSSGHSTFSYYTRGLEREWRGRVWCNPPFNRYERPEWMKKMSEHNNGIMLIPAAMETDAFKNYVFGKACGILMLNHRPHFYYKDGTKAKANSGCTICLVGYGIDNFDRLFRSGLGTMLVQYT